MAESLAQPSLTLWQPTIELLNLSKGVVGIPLDDIPEIDPQQRITLARMSRVMGSLIAPKLEQDPITDRALDIYRRDFRQASVPSIESGLYIPRGDARYPKAELLVTIGHEPSTLQAQGVVTPSTGVVFPREQFAVVARNARDLSKHVRAKTRKANGDNIDRDEVEEKVGRSAAHAMEGKVQSLNSLENQLIEERQFLAKIFRASKSTWSAHFKSKNLDRHRKIADELIHNTAETASINLNLSTVAINAMHRAITSNLYRRGSSREINTMWQRYTKLVGFYTNARRGKVIQSRSACQKELNKYEHYLQLAAD